MAAALCLAAAAPRAEQAIYDEYWDFELRTDPFLATTSGDYRFNDAVPDVSEGAQRARLERLHDVASRLDAGGPGASADPLNEGILRFILEHELALGKFASWRIPFLAGGGFHMDIGYVLSATRFDAASDYRDYLARLEALPGYLEQNRINMQLGIESGFTQPREIMDNILVSFDAQVTGSAEVHPLYAPFRDMSGNITADDRARLRDEAQRLLEEQVIPAYAEKLGVEMGIYDTPYDHFGRLSYEMWRACRLVVDTGIHAKGWTRQHAVDYLASNTALSMHEVGTEIDRYIAWPGQALAYKIGELILWDLRREAEAALGAAFDIREFHDVVLTSGGVPLELLQSMVRQYVDETLDN